MESYVLNAAAEHLRTKRPNYKDVIITWIGDFNPKMINTDFQEQYPYVKTEKVILNNISISSEKQLVVSENPFMFKEVIIKKD